MKTLKSILITAIFVCSTLGFTNAYSESTSTSKDMAKDNVSIKISIMEAQQIPGLSMAIRDQISPKFLLLNSPRYYVFRVKYHGNEYLVHGRFIEWKLFYGH